MVYLTRYEEYPIYEPAEGGYYYAGNQAVEYRRLNSMKQAKKILAKMSKELEDEGFIVSEHSAYLPSRYIGEGQSWRIEKVLGSHESGKQIYQ